MSQTDAEQAAKADFETQWLNNRPNCTGCAARAKGNCPALNRDWEISKFGEGNTAANPETPENIKT